MAAERLSEGDVVAQDLRKLIVNDIKDIRTKLDLMARKDLVTSINIFAEEFENVFNLLHRTSREDNNFSAERVLSTSKSSFEKARFKAIKAFSNGALDISDRILATQYRILAKLLETLDKPANAFKPCSTSLKQLHDLPAIQKTFEIQLSGGAKAWIGEKRRIEVISSVCEVNRLVYDIMQIAVSDEDSQLFSLPGVSESIATDTFGHFIVADSGDCTIKTFDHNGKYLDYFTCCAHTDGEYETLDLDTDSVGNRYLLIKENGICNVKIFDENGNKQFDFPPIKTSKGRAVAVDSETRNVFILGGDLGEKCNALVEVYNKDGHFVRRFGKEDLEYALDITVHSDGRVFVLDSCLGGQSMWISVFLEQGQHLKTFSVVPGAVAMSFNPADANVVVASIAFLSQSGKRHAKVSLYSVSGNHLRTIDLDAIGVTLKESLAVTKEGRIAVALTEDICGSRESKIIVL